MEDKGNSSYPSSLGITLSSSHLEPPPYSEAPPEYSALFMSHTSLPPPSLVYMEHPPVYPAYPAAPEATTHNNTQPSAPIASPQTSSPPVIIINQINNQSVAGHLNAPSSAPHRALLQPTTTRIIHTKATGRRRTESYVTDFETGKEYIIKEKTSRHGLRSKTIIKEIGGPRTIVKETPRKTIVKQKKH